ncbi:hypothetical protein M422DRAFT_269683 [Sphaerobolus stellatus SS14]|uniref:Uncharacterized protein n=1 Tax=Sphaerobolus stellatus (strain SS14) TaxID=990650 RepID=A0A0C9U449_SPHS4|nr:hypothetical protein M422DRAFT_269683 [Sphaerobolus stellatus SS14]
MKLGLPSDYPHADHAALGITDHALIEGELRVGQAHDALKKLCTLLGLKSFIVRRKRQNPRYTITTCTEEEIQKVEGHVKKWRKVWRKPIPEEHRAWWQLRQLRQEDCVMLLEWMADLAYWKAMGERRAAEAREHGSGPRELPWIWKIELDLEGESDEEIEGVVEGLTREAIRLEWLHSKASYEQWEEETRLLKAEGDHVGRSFRWLKEEWVRR